MGLTQALSDAVKFCPCGQFSKITSTVNAEQASLVPVTIFPEHLVIGIVDRESSKECCKDKRKESKFRTGHHTI